MAAVLRDAPPPVTQYQSALPDSAKIALDRMLAKEPDRRHGSFEEVRAEIQRLTTEVSGVTPTSTPAAPLVATADTPTGTRTPYVGRETERAEARRLLDQAAGGQGATLVIGGEPGVGKTRFTEELIREARDRGCLTLVGHCYETEGHPPFIPFVEVLERSVKIIERSALREALGDAAPEISKIAPELRRVFPDIPAPLELPPEQQRRYLFNAYQSFTERAARVMPMVLVLEDLHWAGEPTVLLMQHLAQHLTPLPLLLVGTYRDVELDVGRPWAKVLESLVRERLATRVALRRLPEADIAALLAALGGPAPPRALSRVIFREREGNPFFVEEVFQHLKEEGRLFDDAGDWRADLDTRALQVPEGVRLVIGRRLERVSEDTRKALTVAAVVGRRFRLSVLRAAAGLGEDELLDALEVAERTQLVTAAASGREIRYMFSHELIRQTLQQNLSLPRRQRLHLRVADALEAADGAAETQAAALAHHLYQAGELADGDRTLRYLTLAGRQALAAAAFEETVEHFTRALSFDQLGKDTGARAALLFERGLALGSLAQTYDAIADWEAALTIQERSDDAVAVARTAWDLCWTFFWQDRGTDALAVAERAVRVVPASRSLERTRVLALRAGSLGWSGDYPAFERSMSEARQLAAELGDPLLLGQVMGLAEMMHWIFLRVSATAQAGREAVKALRRADDVRELPNTLAILGFGLACGGHPEEAHRIADEADRLATRVGYDGAAGNARTLAGLTTGMLTGNLQEMERVARGAIEAFGRAGPWSFVGLVALSMSRFYAGDWDEADRYSLEAYHPDSPESFGTWKQGWRFTLRAHRGDGTWIDDYRRQSETLFRHGRCPFQGDLLLAFTSLPALAVADEREEAYRLYPIVLGTIRDGCVVDTGGQMTEMAAAIAAACGAEWDRAARHFETALRQAQEVPNRIAQPEIRRWFAWMLLDRDAPGDREKPRTLLNEAIELYRAIGMPKHVEMAERMLEDAR